MREQPPGLQNSLLKLPRDVRTWVVAKMADDADAIDERNAVIKHLRAALSDCIMYVDCDNLTMQHKHLCWGNVLMGGEWQPGNVEVEEDKS